MGQFDRRQFDSFAESASAIGNRDADAIFCLGDYVVTAIAHHHRHF
jgi:hypothetical protein